MAYFIETYDLPYGYNAADYFEDGVTLLARRFESLDEAQAAAVAAYKGADCDGISCLWDVVDDGQ